MFALSFQTYCLDKPVPDSASTATALFTGVKTNYKVVGVDGRVARESKLAREDETSKLESIIHWAQQKGMSTGTS